jgi:hypothetical protein
MNPRSTHRSTAALIVAVIALIAALAGSAVALPGKNTIDKNDIIKSSVRTKAIKPKAVSEEKLKDGAVSTEKIKDAAVSTMKLVDKAVTGAKIADGAVDTAQLADSAVDKTKLADDAVSSAKVQDASINAKDLGPGVVSVVAYGKIHNPSPGTPNVVSGDVGILSVAQASGSADDDGRIDIKIDPDVLGPTGSLAQCSAQATAAADPEPNGSLGYDSVTLAMGSPAAKTTVEAQTRGSGEVLNDFDFYLQITCPNI